MYELLETETFHQEQVISLIRRFVNLWKHQDCKDTVQEEKKTTNENDINTQKSNEKDIDTQKGNKKDIHTQKSNENEYVEDIVSNRKNIIYSGKNSNETERHDTYETAISTNTRSKEIPLVLSNTTDIDTSMKAHQIQSETLNFENDSSSIKHNQYSMSSNHSFNSIDPTSSYLVPTEDISNKSDKISLSSDYVQFHKQFLEACASTGPIIDKTIPSPSFIPSNELSSVSMSMIEKSSQLFECCLSDDDFELPDVSCTSVLTNSSQLRINET